MQSSEWTPIQLLMVFANFLEEQGIIYRVVGSMASMAYGEPRMTIDIDIVVELNQDHVPKIVSAFPSPEYYLSESAAKNAVRARTQFNVIHIPSGLKVDMIIPPSTEFTRTERSRARRITEANDLNAIYASPEDVILNKLIYFQLSGGASQKHVRDIGGMMKISGREIDAHYIHSWAMRLNVLREWELVLARLSSAES